jgi:hypothetical protein
MDAPKFRYHPFLIADLALTLFELAEKTAQQRAKIGKPFSARARSSGQVLRPGTETPLWTELIRQARPLLRRRGAKASLARLLGIPRQRLHVCITSPSACLDAERTLLLLCWIGAKQNGQNFLGE